ncbi:hypothetical protein LQ948_12615 [Jiella sp. MQZ9-1]|uniref:Uncharacterized protein n=1 Tax=Jiella flava TaxID=2816857 RepID=A0A939G0T3_9HYPH|nr:hypothetical protein [Jiella flava]MBO0663478.1 hypothetical protein [Jiella flava]MCD2472053.1 hypothetical protein [Jiella flava]
MVALLAGFLRRKSQTAGQAATPGCPLIPQPIAIGYGRAKDRRATGRTWQAEMIVGQDSIVDLAGLGIRLRLADLYRTMATSNIDAGESL